MTLAARQPDPAATPDGFARRPTRRSASPEHHRARSPGSLDWTDLDVARSTPSRVLAADAVQKTGNGHPGTAMSLAPVAYLLYQNVMRHDPSDPAWLGRDRFVLSCGHSSLTQYIQLYLSGYGLELEDLKALRTWGILTPGHPEVQPHHRRRDHHRPARLGPGVRRRDGVRARRERGLFDPDAEPGESVFDHHDLVLASDGDIEEGVTSEASSLAGAPGARQPRRDLRPEPHLDRGRHQHRVLRGRRQALRGVRLARPDRRLAPQHRRRRGRLRYVEDVDELLAAIEAGKKVPTSRPSSSSRRSSRGPPRPSRTPASRTARPSATTRSARPSEMLGFDPQKHFPVERGGALARPQGRRPRQGRPQASGTSGIAAWRKANADGPRSSTGSSTGEVPPGWAGRAPDLPDRPRQGHVDAGRLRQGARRAGRRHAGAVGRLRRPRRVQQHDDGGPAVVHPRGQADQRVEGRARRAHPPLRDPRVRDGLHPQRHRPRRAHPRPTAARSSCSPTTCAAPSGWRPSRASR